MKRVLIILSMAVVICGCSRSAKDKEQVMKIIAIPQIQRFIQRNELPYHEAISTNNIKKWRVDFFEKRLGGTAYFQLTNSYSFDVWWDGTNSEIRNFNGEDRPSFYLGDASKAKIEAYKALCLRNKLNDKTALELIKHYFRLQGHREEDFRLMDFGPETWGEKGEPDYMAFPYYKATWYRKDIDPFGVPYGIEIPQVEIEISGISSNMISYYKRGMPIGRDF